MTMFVLALTLQKEAGKALNDFERALSITLGEIMETMKNSITSAPLSPEESEKLSKIYS